MLTDINEIIKTNALLSIYTQKSENDSTGRPIYLGYAEPGTATTAAKWQIRKLTYDSAGAVTDIQFASGTNDFIHVWDNRATYSYS